MKKITDQQINLFLSDEADNQTHQQISAILNAENSSLSTEELKIKNKVLSYIDADKALLSAFENEFQMPINLEKKIFNEFNRNTTATIKKLGLFQKFKRLLENMYFGNLGAGAVFGAVAMVLVFNVDEGLLRDPNEVNNQFRDVTGALSGIEANSFDSCFISQKKNWISFNSHLINISICAKETGGKDYNLIDGIGVSKSVNIGDGLLISIIPNKDDYLKIKYISSSGEESNLVSHQELKKGHLYTFPSSSARSVYFSEPIGQDKLILYMKDTELEIDLLIK